jgi:hypothetical protein
VVVLARLPPPLVVAAIPESRTLAAVMVPSDPVAPDTVRLSPGLMAVTDPDAVIEIWDCGVVATLTTEPLLSVM